MLVSSLEIDIFGYRATVARRLTSQWRPVFDGIRFGFLPCLTHMRLKDWETILIYHRA